MAQILVQSQRPWTRQPPGGVQVGSDEFGRATVVAILGNDGRNLVNNDRPTPSGTIPFKPTTVGVGKSMYTTALRYAKSPGIGSGDFLATLVVRKNAAYNYAYALSGTSDVSSGIHLFCEHASVSGQWGIVANGTVRGCGAALALGRDYVLQILRVGTTVYYLQDGQATPTPSTTISGSVFLDSAWSIGEYKPSGSFGGDICVSGLSVQKGTFSLVQAKALAANPWQLFRPRRQVTYFDLVAGGSVSLSIQDATHGHVADSLSLSSETLLSVADAAHSQAADNLALDASTATNLVTNEASHAHLADNAALTTEWLLAIAEALHGHAADSLSLSSETLLSVADAEHAHSADALTLDTSDAATLVVQGADHAHTAEALGLTLDTWLAIVDAWHAHSADNLRLGGLYSTLDLIYKILTNRQELNPTTGKFVLYDDDNVSVLYQADAWADAAGTAPYAGNTLARIDRLQ